MAYVYSPDQNQQGPASSGPVQVTSGPGNTSAVGGGTPGGANVSAGTSPTGTAPTSATGTSGQFVNIGAYLDANQAGANNLGQQSASTINNAATTAQNAINTSNQGWQQAVQGGTDQYNPDLVNSALANPTGYVGNAALSSQLSGNYNGPTNYAGSAQDATSLAALQSADQQGQLANTSGGRGEILQQLETQPGATPYTSGGLELNQFLEQNTASALNPILGASANEAQLTPQYQNATTAANQALVTPAQQASAQAGQQTSTALQGGVTNLRDQIQQNVTKAQQGVTNQNNALSAFLAGQTPGSTVAVNPAVKAQNVLGTPGSITPAPATNANLQQLGVSADVINNLNSLNQQLVSAGGKPVDLSTYLTGANPNTITAGNVATADQQAQYNALNQILGTSPGTFLQAGTAQGTPSFNAQGAQTAIQGQITALQQQQAQASAQAQANANSQAQINASTQKSGGGSGIMAGAALGFAVGGPVGGLIGGVLGGIGSALGSVVCTEVHSRGDITDKQRRTIYVFSLKALSSTTYRGYQYWGVPLVKLMRKNKLVYKFGKAIVNGWLVEAEHHMLNTPKRSLFGIALLYVVRPISYIIGTFVKQVDYQSLYTKGVL